MKPVPRSPWGENTLDDSRKVPTNSLVALDSFLFVDALDQWTPSASPNGSGALGILAKPEASPVETADAGPVPMAYVQVTDPNASETYPAMSSDDKAAPSGEFRCVPPNPDGPGCERPASEDVLTETMARPRTAPTKAVVAARALAADADGFTGDGKTVVVIDTGWSPWYDQSNTIFSYDFSGRNDANASVNTLNSHGSWVAQTITRVAADVDIIHLKVFSDAGAGNTTDVEEALRWCVANVSKYDIAAVNLSLGFGNALTATQTSLSDEFAALDAKGVFNIVAAGNSGSTYRNGVNVIAADPNAIAVSATDASDRYTDWTQKHARLTDIAALGAGIEVETINGLRGYVSGTSFAAPYIAGIAARLQEATESIFGVGARLDERELLGILRASGDRVVEAPTSWKGAVVADADDAVDWFLDHAAAYTNSVWV